MKRYSAIAILVVVLMALVFSGCTMPPLQAPEDQVEVEEAIDYDLNPELKFLVHAPGAGLAAEEVAVDASGTPAIHFATSANHVAGDWLCEQEDGPQLIRLDQDGRILRLLGPNDAVDIGYFWFSDDELHVMSDVDEAARESVFQVIVETVDDGTFLRFEQCGGNCTNACDIEWQNGLTLYES